MVLEAGHKNFQGSLPVAYRTDETVSITTLPNICYYHYRDQEVVHNSNLLYV